MAKAMRGSANMPNKDSAVAPDVGGKNKMAKNDTTGAHPTGTGSSSVIKRWISGTRAFGGDVKSRYAGYGVYDKKPGK